MKKNKAGNYKSKNAVLLLLVVIFGLILRIAFFSGVGTSDDLLNTRYSHDISKGIFPTTQNQGNSRIGLLMPTSIIYSLFGINDFTSVLIVLLFSLAGIILIYFFGKLLFSEKVGLLAAFLLSFFPLDVIYSTKFLSDLPSAFFGALSVFLFLKAEKITGKSKNYFIYLLSGLSLGIAFSVREMAVLLIPFFGLYALYKRKFKTSYFAMALGFLFVLSLEMIFFYIHTGNAFYRFSSLSGYYVEAARFHNFYGRTNLVNFLAAWPYVMFANIQLGYFYAFISLALAYFLRNRKTETNWLIIWMLSILLIFIFGTSSIKTYAPFLAVARYLSYITVPALLLLSAFFIEHKDSVKGVLIPFGIIFLLLASAGAVYLDNSRHKLDGLRDAYLFLKSSGKPVYTDSRSKLALEYISGYGSDLKLIDFEKDIKNLRNAKDSYIIINSGMLQERMIAGENIQFTADLTDLPAGWAKVMVRGTKENNILVYYAR